MKKETPLSRAVFLLGGIVSMAATLNLKSYQVVQQWLRSRVPTERCPDIERATDGAVTCEELRPDLAEQWAYLRNSKPLNEASPAHIPCGATDPRHGERRDGDRRHDNQTRKAV